MVIPYSNPHRYFSLYVHIPFCTRKCPYCHFFVMPHRKALEKVFLEALLKELEESFPILQKKEVVSLYFGGGTPILFPKGIEKIIEQTKSFSPYEITIEANPEDLTLSLLKTCKGWGVNRISLGIQSFDDTLLQILGRTHNAKRGIEAVELAHRAGISNISIDLMVELPFQTMKSWKQTLMLLPSLSISHVSLYNLTFEPGTSFYKRRNEMAHALPSEEEGAEMVLFATYFLEGIGFKQYEISAFAKEGKMSIHNTGYWLGRPFLGLGPSAFSFVKGRRFQNVCNFNRYIEALQSGKSPISFEEQLHYPAHLFELLAIRLRLTEGVDLTLFERDFLPLPPSIYATFRELEEEGFLSIKGSHLSLTERGRLFHDLVAEKIIA